MISIITAALNHAEHLEGCLQSVFMQRGASFEHIVIDGRSTDGSVAILNQWSDRLTYWISEPDKGIGDAMNKGLLKAKGDWLLFLHADDQLLTDHSLQDVATVLNRTKADIVGLPIRFGSEKTNRVITPRGANTWLRLKTGFLHQGTFIRRTVFDEVGLYDINLRVAMDYDFFLRAWLRGVSIDTFSQPIPTLMRNTGRSSQLDWPSLAKRFAEERAVQERYCTSTLQRSVYALYWALYLPYRKVRSLIQDVDGQTP